MGESVGQILERLRTARDAAEVFGFASTDQELQRAYRVAAMRCHPDRCPGDGEAAGEAFVRLTRWLEVAREQLRAGTYGCSAAGAAGATAAGARLIRLRHKEREYAVSPAAAFRGDFANVYRALHAGGPVAVKVARRASDNDLLVAERTALRRIAREVDGRFRPFFPSLLDGFAYAGGVDGDGRAERATNVLAWAGGAYTLDEIRRAYRRGVDPKDAAWICRRLLAALGAAHRAGLVHGAVLPPHVCVLPEEHGLVLIGWTCAVEAGSRVTAISDAYEPWYPKEVMTKEPATPETDVAMAARCMEFLLPEDAPAALSRFFRGCQLPSPRQRPGDAWALLREFDGLLARLWGARRFHHFAVPAPCPR
jgi:hypothetical protein